VQMRKLTSDVFDQIKTVKGNGESQNAIERVREGIKQTMEKEKESTRHQLQALKDENDNSIKELWNQMRN